MGTSTKQRQASKNGKFEFRRLKNIDVRPREYLTDTEVERLMTAAAKTGRHGHRDSTLILVTYRHCFRVSELVALRWDQVEFDSGRMHVSRIKKGTPSVHPIRGIQRTGVTTRSPGMRTRMGTGHLESSR